MASSRHSFQSQVQAQDQAQSVPNITNVPYSKIYHSKKTGYETPPNATLNSPTAKQI